MRVKKLLFLLFPIALLYDLITSLRNFFFDHNFWIYKSTQFDVFTISVGNLSVGGAGKTPMVEYLIELLADKFNTATLSRGYGRKTSGIIIADETSNPTQIGDEPMQYYQKYKSKIQVVVGEERSVAIPYFCAQYPQNQLIILDDAYQHRWIKPHINILVSDFNQLFTHDFLLPVGRLRESRIGAKRADIMIISKCPEEMGYRKEYILTKARKYLRNNDVPVFFTKIIYQNPKAVFQSMFNINPSTEIVLFCGLANPHALIEYVKANYKLASTFVMKDHQDYSLNSLKPIFSNFKSINSANKCLMVTEKDMVKLLQTDLAKVLSKYPIFYVPIKIEFISDKQLFDHIISTKLSDYHKNSKN